MSSPDYSDGPANVQYPADSFITYCLVSCFLLLGALPRYTYFKRKIQWIFVCIKTIIKRTYFSITGIFETSYGLYILWKELQQLQPHKQQHKQLKTDSLVQILPPHEEFITEVREQLIQPSFMEQTTSFQDSQQDFQVFGTEYSLNLHIPNVSIERIHSPPVVHNDGAFTEFVKGEERCLKFVNQDLTYLQESHMPSTFSNICHAPTQLKESSHITLPTCISTEDNNTSCTQVVELTLGFTLAEICHPQNEPKLTVSQLLKIESCKDYTKILLQTLDGIYVTQPKWFLSLCTRGEKISRGILERRNCISVSWTPT